MAWYVVSTKSANLKFRILKLDKATLRATLQGETGVPFERTLDEETLTKFGYTIQNIQEPAPAQ